MKLIFEISGEHETLPSAEVIASLEAEDIQFKVEEKLDRILIINSEDIDVKRLRERLALTFIIDKGLIRCEPKNINEIIDCTKNLNIGKGSFCIRARKIGKYYENLSTKEIEKKLGMYFTKNKVKLKNPDIELRVILSNKCYIGIKKVEIDRKDFEKRKAQHRPFFSPISIHPRLARVLVNLSRVKSSETLLDPFCGTGGILIEASLIGAKVVGSDVQEKMVEGTRKNLKFFKISNYDLFCSDISNVKNYVNKVDAIATDLPYGRSSFLQGEIEYICNIAFKTFKKILKDNCYASIILHNKNLIEIGKKYLNFEEMHKIKAHGSLNRYFCTYKK